MTPSTSAPFHGLAADEQIRQTVSTIMSDHFGSGIRIDTLAILEPRHATNFGAHIVSVSAASGEVVSLFLKDYSAQRFNRPDLPKRRDRERSVYRDLLDARRLGTAIYYGDVFDDDLGRYWVFLEFVDGTPLRSCGFDYWVESARWLGRFHAYGMQQSITQAGYPYLAAYDVGHLWRTACNALEVVFRHDRSQGDRLRPLLQSFKTAVANPVMAPTTLIHGSYRPQNIVISAAGSPFRICPVDWEYAGLGSALYDLAFLLDGFRGAERLALLDGYRAGLTRANDYLPEWGYLDRGIATFQLHKTFRSLSELETRDFSDTAIEKLVSRAENLHSLIM